MLLTYLNVVLIYAVIILFGSCNYKKHCISDLEKSLSKVRKQKNELLSVLRELDSYKSMSNASRDTHSRRLVEETLAKYSDFEKLLKLGSEENIKKELSNDCESDR